MLFRSSIDDISGACESIDECGECGGTDISCLGIHENLIPDIFTLNSYPNPFNPVTYLTFLLPQSDFVSIKIMDTMGKVLETPIHQFITAGYHSINWDASTYSSGVYLVNISSGNPQSPISQSRKVVLLK